MADREFQWIQIKVMKKVIFQGKKQPKTVNNCN
jgi:hypothetical protein